MFRCQRKCHRFDPDILLQTIMYKIYFTDPKSQQPFAVTTQHLEYALKSCENLRRDGMLYVTMVSDYPNMVGKPGVSGAGAEYVPQLKN